MVGNPVTKRTRAGDTFTTTFDALNRIIRVEADTVGARAVPQSRLTYDNLGRTLTTCFWVASACTQTVSAGWDALGRQTSETGPLGVVGYGYDLAGRRTSVAWPDAFTVGYAWDLSDQVTAITQGAATLASYAYDNLSRRTQRPATPDNLIRSLQRETERQRSFVRRASITQSRLRFVVNAFRHLLADDRFTLLMKAEGIHNLPTALAARIGPET